MGALGAMLRVPKLGRSCSGVDVTGLEVEYQLAIGGDLGGPKVGRFL